MTFAEALKSTRKKRKMTQEALARMVGTSKQTIQRYEAGVIQTPPMVRVEALALALGVPPAALMGWEDAAKDTGALKQEVTPHTLHSYTVTEATMVGDGVHPGDVLLYEEVTHVEKGRLVLVESKGQVYVRRWYHYPQKQALVLVASDGETEPMLYLGTARTHIHLLGVVREIQRKLR